MFSLKFQGLYSASSPSHEQALADDVFGDHLAVKNMTQWQFSP